MNHKGGRRRLNPGANRDRRAFTLLEVILALGILAASLAIVGEVTRLAYRNAERAAMEGEALLIAESVMAQMLSGVMEPIEIPPTEWVVGNQQPAWTYEMAVGPTELPELLNVQVRVVQVTEETQPISVQLSRWVIDPAYIEELADSASGGAL